METANDNQSSLPLLCLAIEYRHYLTGPDIADFRTQFSHQSGTVATGLTTFFPKQ